MLDMLASLQSFGRSPVSIDTWKGKSSPTIQVSIYPNWHNLTINKDTMQKQNQTNYHKAGRTREITIKGQPVFISLFKYAGYVGISPVFW
jgi:hypothetical protein